MTYWAVTGRPPFKGKTLLAIAHGHLNEPLPPIEPIFEVPSGLADWIGRLMAKNPYDRYEFAADAALGLARVDAEAETALQTLTLVTGSFNIAHLQTDTIVDHKSAFAAVSGLPSQPLRMTRVSHHLIWLVPGRPSRVSILLGHDCVREAVI